jgi:hypothetical protein
LSWCVPPNRPNSTSSMRRSGPIMSAVEEGAEIELPLNEVCFWTQKRLRAPNGEPLTRPSPSRPCWRTTHNWLHANLAVVVECFHLKVWHRPGRRVGCGRGCHLGLCRRPGHATDKRQDRLDLRLRVCRWRAGRPKASQLFRGRSGFRLVAYLAGRGGRRRRCLGSRQIHCQARRSCH